MESGTGYSGLRSARRCTRTGFPGRNWGTEVDHRKSEDRSQCKNDRGGKRGQTQVKCVETVVFVPCMPNSVLTERLQKADDQIVTLLNTPGVKFVERGGTMLIFDAGRTNPWSQDWFCPIKE